MKITTKQYAQALFEAVIDKTESEIKPLIVRFVKILYEAHLLNKAKEIGEKFVEIFEKRQGELSVTLTSAHAFSEELNKEIISYVKRKSGRNNIELKENVDANILGGFILQYDNKIIEASTKKELIKMRNALKK
ncbi:MAG: F0F1 ATP synthase subunit delta [Planctomycetes bacterium]|jgi:F-type H+-transporting ATPase subunit delta|nr:F0F1 ATP synthase subunit delta [Planctomycetota bacterium]